MTNDTAFIVVTFGGAQHNVALAAVLKRRHAQIALIGAPA